MEGERPTMTAEEKKAQREAKKKLKQEAKKKGEKRDVGTEMDKASSSIEAEVAAANQVSRTPNHAGTQSVISNHSTPGANVLPNTPPAPDAPLPTLQKEQRFQSRSNVEELSRLAQASNLNPNAVAFIPGAASPPSKNAVSKIAAAEVKGATSATKNATCGNAQDSSPHLQISDKVKTGDDAKTPIPTSKAELRRKRREEQEAQRAAKAAAKGKAGQGARDQVALSKDSESKGNVKESKVAEAKKTEVIANGASVASGDARPTAKKERKAARALERQGLSAPPSLKKDSIFAHLPLFQKTHSLTKTLPLNDSSPVHPSFVRIGLQIREGNVLGSNARCVALMMATRALIRDYVTSPNTEISRDLEAKLKPNLSFLNQCRVLSVSQGNFVKFVKQQTSLLERTLSESEAKSRLLDKVDDYYRDKIELAGQAISNVAKLKIRNGDVIMTYACSSLVVKALLDANANDVSFSVIAVDGRPRNEGRELTRRLASAGIRVTYVDVNFVPYVINDVSKVFLGAAALLANGCVMSRVGAAQVSLVAKSANKPVIVCCETYKFCERAQTDAIVSNELSDPSTLLSASPLADLKREKLTVLNINYDLTPPSLIALVITERGAIPCTSVPVVLRVKELRAA